MRSVRAFALVGFSLLAASPAFASIYDGNWNVTIYTNNGNCEPSYRYPVTISNGRVSTPQGDSGSVNSSGIVKVSINGAFANGVMNGSTGSGKWNGASSGVACSGRWEASKQ